MFKSLKLPSSMFLDMEPLCFVYLIFKYLLFIFFYVNNVYHVIFYG